MKKIPVFVWLMIVMAFNSNAQDSNWVKSKIAEGIQLHDQGKFEAAIQKYDEALQRDPGFIIAMYEKSYSLMASKKYQEAIQLSQQIIDQPGVDPDMMGNAYSTWGNAVDEEGDHKKALKVFDEGIKRVPEFNMLNFNKAITYVKLNDIPKAVSELKLSLLKNPVHLTSHMVLSRLMYFQKNKLGALMPMMVFLLFENKSRRSDDALKMVRDIIENKAIGLGQSAPAAHHPLFNFRARPRAQSPGMEALMALEPRIEKILDSIHTAGTEILPGDLFASKIDAIIQVLNEQYHQAGFYGNFYLPFFKDIHQKGMSQLLAHHIYFSSGNVMNEIWLQDHRKEVDEFLVWAEGYQWNTKYRLATK